MKSTDTKRTETMDAVVAGFDETIRFLEGVRMRLAAVVARAEGWRPPFPRAERVLPTLEQLTETRLQEAQRLWGSAEVLEGNHKPTPPPPAPGAPALALTCPQNIEHGYSPGSFTLDGEPVDIHEFIHENWQDFGEAERRSIQELSVGDEIVYGGGAAATFVLRRVG